MFFNFFEFNAFFVIDIFFHLCIQNILKTYHETKLTVLKSNFLVHESGQSFFFFIESFILLYNNFYGHKYFIWPKMTQKIFPNQRMHVIKKEHISNKFHLMHSKNFSFYKCDSLTDSILNHIMPICYHQLEGVLWRKRSVKI